LNASSRASSWAQLALLPPTPLAAREVDRFNLVTGARGELSREGGLEEFKRQLERSAGKSVTVVVQDGGKESKFTFTVPLKGFELK
jgi:hypothetical protein